MPRPSYPSGVSGEAWALLHPLVPEAADHAGKQPVDRRETIDAIFDVVRTGVQWRYLPHDFPRWRMVYEFFSKWSGDGTRDRVGPSLRWPRSLWEDVTTKTMESAWVRRARSIG